jgi:hypothetical protein
MELGYRSFGITVARTHGQRREQQAAVEVVAHLQLLGPVLALNVVQDLGRVVRGPADLVIAGVGGPYQRYTSDDKDQPRGSLGLPPRCGDTPGPPVGRPGPQRRGVRDLSVIISSADAVGFHTPWHPC